VRAKVYEITLFGQVPGKKNRYSPTVNKKTGKAMFIKDSKLQKELDDLLVQIPGELRNLRLESPDIEVELTVPNGRADRDNIFTSLLDVLVQARVLRNDSTAASNGRYTIYPATISDYYKTVIRITPR
jgi:Holliday junction resolvase RusA-like endonuclease